MTYSNSASELPPFTPFDSLVEQSTSEVVLIEAGRHVGDPTSTKVTWSAQITDDQFVLSNGLDLAQVFTVPLGSVQPTVQFDMNNNPTIAYNDNGFIRCQSLGLQTLVEGKVKSADPLDLAEISIQGNHPKLVKSEDDLTSIIQLFCICPIDGSSYLCCFDLGETINLVACFPTSIPYTAKNVRIPDEITANTAYVGPQWIFGENSAGVPYLDGTGNSGSYAQMVFNGLGDFSFSFERPAPLIANEGSKYVFIFSETGTDHSDFLISGSYQTDSIYFITDVTTNTVEVINTFSGGISYSGMSWYGENFIDYFNQTLNYQFELGGFSSPVPPPTNSYSWTVMSISEPLQSTFASFACGLFDSTTGPFIQQGDEISYSVNGGPVQTFTAGFTDTGIFVIQEMFNEIFANQDPDFYYYQSMEDPPLYTDGFLHGIDVDGVQDALKLPMTVTLFLSTASASFQTVLKSQVDLEFHTCGGLPFTSGPG